MPDYFNDSPISSPNEDRFGIDPFARALASSISKIGSPVGATIALNGPWGSGKSSAINLIRHHLNQSEEENLVIVDFKCWWFRGEEALTLAFLQTLNGALERGLGERAKRLLGKIGKNLLQAGPVIGPAINFASGGAWSALSSLLGESLDFSKRYFSDGESIESIFNDLSRVLAEQTKRFVIVIDDIDRLTPEEAVLVFRLLKSVGRLPNVLYIVIFDRELAEKAVSQKYPTEGPHFLEKIIQASFEVPMPARDDLNNAFLTEVETTFGVLKAQEDIRDLMNLFYDVVAPRLNSPRDLTRLVNSIAVSWPPVAHEVNQGDFIAIEAIRVFEGALFNAIRANKSLLCGVQSDYVGRLDEREKTIRDLLKTVSEGRKEEAKTALMRLFPRLENVGYASSFVEKWEADRRICSEKHFDTYFRMAVGDEALPIRELNDLISRAGETEYIKASFLSAVRTIRKNGKSKVPLLLDELNVHAAKIEKQKFPSLISALFEVADDIDREGDRERGFSFGNNQLRIHWLIRKLTFERCSLDERTDVFKVACANAQVGWLVDFASSARSDFYPREGKQPEPPEKCLVGKEYLDDLIALALEKLKTTTPENLIEHPRLAYLLFRWRDLAQDDGKAVRSWTSTQLYDDKSVALFAKAFTQESWSQGMGMIGLGDRIAMRHLKASTEGLEKVLDVDRFMLRLKELGTSLTLQEPFRGYVATFLEALAKKESGEDD
ncbi:MAG: P-loop NTPase fold protein [Parvibaculaceae bacterium]